jgi:hypothetical protein
MKWLVFLLLIGTTLGQNPAPSQNPAPKNDTGKPKTVPSPAVTKCRSELDTLNDKEFEDFQEFPTSRLKEIRETLETCLRDSYDGMTKYQLALAGIMLEWTQRTVYQRHVDEELARPHANSAGSKDSSRPTPAGTVTARTPNDVH